MNFKIEKSDVIFKGRVFDLKVDQIKYSSGNLGVRETAVHPGGAVVVPVKDDKIIFISQYRFPLDKVLIELPAGKLDKEEDPEICATRELEEETGYKSERITKLGKISTTPGFCTEILHLYLAEKLTEGKHNREEGEEGMELIELTFEEAEQKIVSGEIYDAKSICAFYLAKAYLYKK